MGTFVLCESGNEGQRRQTLHITQLDYRQHFASVHLLKIILIVLMVRINDKIDDGEEGCHPAEDVH